MARQVEDIFIRLGVQGFENLDRVKSSFRDLGKVTNMAEADVMSVRDRLLEYAKTAGNTEAANKGLISAFQGLRSQADMCGSAYDELTQDLRRFSEVQQGATTASMRNRDELVRNFSETTRNIRALREHRDALIAIQAQTRQYSRAYDVLSNDIAQVRERIEDVTAVTRTYNQVLTRVAPGTAAGASRRNEQLKEGIQLQRAIINEIDLLPSKERKAAAAVNERAAAVEKLNQGLAQQRILSFQERARAGRESVRAGAAAFADEELTVGYLSAGKIQRRLGELPNTTAGLNQELSELNERLNNTTRSSVEYLKVAMQIAGVQRELAQVTAGYAQSLVMGLRTGTVVSSAQNIRQAITALRAEMEQLDTSTAEGSRHYAENANEAHRLTQQLNRLGNSYRHVGDMAAQAATAEQNAANARIRNNYLNRGMVRQQEAALAELGQRVRAGVAGTPLLLPAAGQTSAPGTGAAISGGARRLVAGRTESVLGAPATRSAAQQTGLPSAAVGAPAAIGLIAEAYDRQAARAFKASESLDKYFVAISKATQESNNSINSLNKQRQAWEDLRNAIPRTYKLYEEASDKIREFDKQLERSQLQRRRLSGMQVTQGVGAAISGGIFGGPEGLVGGLAGLAVGGVGGAFAGAAIGAQAGMLRQQLGLVAQYVAQLNLAKTTLAQASTGQADYNNMLASARKISADYAVTLQDTLRGYAQVAVAARANGLSVKETEQVYRGVIAAGVAFGKSQTDLDAIVTATVQVLSKGKVSAEELSGQIGERLPGAVAKFAAATGRTLPELAKALQEGQVNISDFVKFAQQQFTDYDSIARVIGDSPEKAGARLRIALDTIAESYGGFLQNSGATFQDAAGHVLGWVISNESSIKRFLSVLSLFGKDLVAILKSVAQTTISIFKPVFSFIFENAARGIAAIRTSIEALQQADYAGASARAQKAVEKLYPNPLERALKGAPAYQEALNVELQKMNKRFGSGYTDLLNAEAARLFKQFQPSQYGTPSAAATAATGAGTDAANKDKAAKKAKSDADSIAAHQQRLAETELDQRLRLEDTIYKHGVELDRKRYELQKNLSDLQAQNRIAKETGVSRDILSNFYQFQQDLRALTERRLDAERAVEDAKRAASSAAARAALSGQMPPSVSGTGAYKPGAFSRRVRDPDAERTGYDIVHPGGLGAPVRTPVALTITGTGFQGRGAGPTGKGYGNWISGEFELGGKKYEMVVGHFGQIDVAPGMKVPAGGSLGTQGITGRAFGAHATTHVNPKAGATTADAWNALDSITTALQQGRTLGATKLPTGVGAQQLRATKQGGNAKIEQADVAKAKADLALIKQNEAKEAAALAEKFTISITQNLREQNQALIESNQLQALKNRLSYEGFSPERIELELSLEKQRLDLAKAGAAFAQARAYVTGLENISDDEKTRRLAQLNKDQGEYNDHMRTYIQLLNEAYIANQNYNQSIGTGFREGLSKYVEGVGTMREATSQLTQTGVKGLEDALFSLVTTGTANFQEFAASILRDTARMILQLTIQKVIMQILGAINPAAGAGAGAGAGFDFGGPSGGFNLPGFQMPGYMQAGNAFGFANGGAFGKNGIVPFAYGGIVNKPTLFQFANGGTAATGLLGEAGPEAILPLRRGPSGRLGVETSGAASSMNVTVNVDASGTKAEGDGGRAEQLGRVVSQAVQAELIKQKRPGGLLA